MGCVSACLGISRHRNPKLSSNPVTSGVQNHEARQFREHLKQETIGNSISTILQSEEKFDDDLRIHTPKKVTFCLDAKNEEENFLKKSAIVLVDGNKEKVGEKREEAPKESKSLVESFTPIAVKCCPSNDRCQDYRDSDNGLDDLGLELDDNEGETAIEEESLESLFSLSTEARRRISWAAADKEINSPSLIESRELGSRAATDENEEMEINSPMLKPLIDDSKLKPGESKRDENTPSDKRLYVVDSVLNPVESPCQWKKMKARSTQPAATHQQDSVLNPVESPSQWKKMKARSTQPAAAHQEKENMKLDVNVVVSVSRIEPKPSLKPLSQSRKPVDEEGIAVDAASLSSWLLGLETSPNSKTSAVSVGNSPSEGAKSTRQEDIKQLSASSLRRSQSRSSSLGDERMIGTVGCYWSHTGALTAKEF